MAIASRTKRAGMVGREWHILKSTSVLITSNISATQVSMAATTHLKQRTWCQQQTSGWTSQRPRSGQRRGFQRWCQQSMTWQRGSWKREWHSSRLRSKTRERTWVKGCVQEDEQRMMKLSSDVWQLQTKMQSMPLLYFLIFLLTLKHELTLFYLNS